MSRRPRALALPFRQREPLVLDQRCMPRVSEPALKHQQMLQSGNQKYFEFS